MLRKVLVTTKYQYNSIRLLSTAVISEKEPAMFCYQCEQTQDNVGCTTVGVCGKDSRTAALQDLQLHFNVGIGQWANAIREKGGTVPDSTKDLLLDSTFATLTNVNFDSKRFLSYLKKANAARDELKQQAQNLKVDTTKLTGPALFHYNDNEDFLRMEAKVHGVLSRKSKLAGDESTLGLREMAQYGIKGTMAYFNHAERLRKLNPSAYSAEDRDAVYDQLFNELAQIAPEKPKLGNMVNTCLSVGGTNLKVMELLDKAHTSTFGHPVPTEVSTIPSEGKCILISGHDLVDVLAVLKATEGTGINVYTHGELLPAFGYPELKKYPHLKGHYGNAWQKQKVDFARFPGAILLTSNCLVEPLPNYKNRIFTINSVGFEGVPHLTGTSSYDLAPLIECAMNAPGFQEKQCSKKTSSADKFTVGFGHNAVLGVADKLLDAVNQGELKNIFLIGGCDGSEGERNYFTNLAEQLPSDSLALTLGCGKFRVNGLDMGTLPNGINRLIDMGQCNDSYGAVKVALALADALNTDVNGLPLHFALSWFEQKAVAVLLTLLHLNIKNIRVGPNLPAFVTPAVLDVLVQNFQIKPINSADAAADLKSMIERSTK